ncbi:MAG: SIMPL domain-containing protein [Thalassobaculaceae bacterium]|nr:SIMPL domain-containing protein [Thalassobaculaceae bacterium]
MPDQLRIIALLLSAVVVAIGVAVGGKFIGDGFRDGRAADRFVSVKGVAEREVTANLAVWPVRITETGDDLGATQSRLEQDVDALIVFLVGEGILQENILRGRAEVQDLLAQAYRPDGIEKGRYILAQTVTVRTDNVTLVDTAAARIGELVKMGVVFAETGGPSYVFTGLNEIKPDMIAEATKAAREGAQRFAEDSGSTVGAIRQANQGVFTIGPLVGWNSGNPAGAIEKRVRVVSTIDFFLRD